MVSKGKRRLALAILWAAGLSGCNLPQSQLGSTSPTASATSTTVGNLEPVYNPPPNTPFRCIGAGDVVTPDQVPGDVTTPLPQSSSPVATMGNRRGDWLLIVTRTGEIGWIDDPHEMPLSQEYPGSSCHVYQDAQGRIAFKYHLARGTF